MQILVVGQGYSAGWTVQLRDDTPPAGLPIVETYNGSEPLTLVVCDGAGAALTLNGSTVEWLDPAAGTVMLHIDDSDTTTLGPGRFGLSIVIVDGGEPYECFRAVLRVESRVTP